jgi:hypothetical protein
LHVHTLIEISFSVGNNNPCREDRKIWHNTINTTWKTGAAVAINFVVCVQVVWNTAQQRYHLSCSGPPGHTIKNWPRQ